MRITREAVELWKAMAELLERSPRDRHGELADADALALRQVWIELAIELRVSPLLEPHRSGHEVWWWVRPDDQPQMERWRASWELSVELDGARVAADRRHQAPAQAAVREPGVREASAATELRPERFSAWAGPPHHLARPSIGEEAPP